MQLVRIEPETGNFIEDVILDSAPSLEDGTPDPTYIFTPCPPGFYWPRWDGEKWVEGGTAPEPAPPEPTLEERTAALEAAMLDLILGGAV